MLFAKSRKSTKTGSHETARVKTIVTALLVAIVASACSIDTTDAEVFASGAETATEDQVVMVTTPDAEEAAADQIEDDFNPIVAARPSVVRIVSQGTFLEPDGGFGLNQSGSGSGFIISEDGLAVTNNHVVAGAAFLQVYVDGESRPRNARVLGASECLDLAVIDIAGDGFSALPWSDQAPFVGQPIFALGYPLGDTQYTALDGIVSKEMAQGESDFASVDTAIEHSAAILGGNSGGPLIDEDGNVVAVNYGGNFFGQSFAIRADLAKEVIGQLIDGNNLEWIGISGQAYFDDEIGLSGVFVRSVESGSPADELGIEPGDLIVTLEGLLLATDGTMADYCDILRSNAQGDALSIEVYRSSTGELLDGWLNSGKAFGE